MKTVIVTLEIQVPDEATDEDIQDYVFVEFEGVNSMKQDNPCIGSEVTDSSWEYE